MITLDLYLLEILLVLLFLQESEMQLGKTYRSFPLYWFFKLGSDYAFRLFLWFEPAIYGYSF
jgi:hypothetical protein